MTNILETERLILRHFNIDDTRFIIEIVNTPGWLEFIGDRHIKTEEHAEIYLQDGPLRSYRENGFGLCLVETKADNKAIGMCGLLKRDYLDNPDIGFAFLPAFTGKGFAHEMAKATLIYAFEALKISKISAITKVNNERSIKLLQKIGLKFIHPLAIPNEKEALLLYALER